MNAGQSWSMRQDRDEFDVVILGAGAGGMTAAAVAAVEGLRVLLLEKAPMVGGTTAISGGMIWIPDNAKMKAVGRSDGRANADAYLASTVPGPADVTRLIALTCPPGLDRPSPGKP
jgi:succinate dehydrogenase/fumarate reductase flavoprotein subunit